MVVNHLILGSGLASHLGGTLVGLSGKPLGGILGRGLGGLLGVTLSASATAFAATSVMMVSVSSWYAGGDWMPKEEMRQGQNQNSGEEKEE